MSLGETAVPPAELPEMRWMLRQLQDQTLQLALPPLLIAGLALLGFPWRFQDPARAEWLGLALWLLVLAVWALGKVSGVASAWLFVAGCLAMDLLVVTWGGAAPALYLLNLPVAVAALAVSLAAGVAVAAGSTFLLLWAPGALLPVDASLRAVTLIGVWGTLGLVWLTLRPLLTALQWSWSSYEQSRRLLDQARDYQVQLKQTLQDLADANLQLTRLNRLAQALRRTAEDARGAKEQFVANVSHELRTPLNMIVGFSEMIVQAPEAYGASLPPALLADLAVILRNSQHLSGLIDDVLDLSQIEVGRMALTRERVSLPEMVDAATAAVSPLYESKGLRLRVDVPPGLPPLFCDRTRVREILLNLLSNAGRFTEQGGVEVRAWREGDDLVVSVADTGPGIAAEQKGRLFEPFEQLDGSIRRSHGGSGLGLSISKALVELHGGQMWVESRLHEGTTFYFRLPINPPAPADDDVSRWFGPYWHYEERTRTSLAPRPVVRPRFVVLEDGNTLQRLLSRYLDGVETVSVSSIEGAIEELSRVPARALLINAESVSEALQELNRCGSLPYGTPALVCSVPGVLQAADSLGIAGYLVKPISRDLLLEALDRLQLRGKTILIVDDEPEALQLFQRMLTMPERRYRVLRASNGQEALNILRRQRPDAILLDLVMPGMDGFRLLELQSQDPALCDIPVIVISARDPAGQPIVSSSLGVSRGGGLSVPQVLACVESLSGILATAGQAGDPEPRETPPGSPASG